jgi:DNA-binding HxlR family transcriptional regulator
MKMKAITPDSCGLGIALKVIGGKWRATILWELHAAPVRFGALRRRLTGISEKVLFEQLREMEADGIVRREVFDDVAGRVEYSVTAAGASLNDAVHALSLWGTAHAGRDTAQSVRDAAVDRATAVLEG